MGVLSGDSKVPPHRGRVRSRAPSSSARAKGDVATRFEERAAEELDRPSTVALVLLKVPEPVERQPACRARRCGLKRLIEESSDALAFP